MMFFQKRTNVEQSGVGEKVRAEAERLYRSGKLHCAEAVLASVKNEFRPEVTDDVVHLAAGFGHGSWSHCICGAVSGGTMALGLVLREEKKKCAHLTRELHVWFKEKYGSACCQNIVREHKGACPTLTGMVAGKIAEMLAR